MNLEPDESATEKSGFESDSDRGREFYVNCFSPSHILGFFDSLCSKSVKGSKSMKRMTIGIVLPLILVSLTGAIPANAAPLQKCTIFGTDKSDRITGTAGNDVICAGGGNDTVNGLGGDDVIYGGSGNDSIAGGSGSDSLTGGQGRDALVGGAGEDVLLGGMGDDNLSGGKDSDVIDGGEGSDKVRSGAGSDICGADSRDTLLDACTLDRKGPQFGVLTSEVKQFKAGSIAVFTVRLSDPAGVSAIYGNIGGPPGWVTEWCGFLITGALVEGSQKSGTFQLSCTIPDNAVNENYTLFLRAIDLMGNSGVEQQIAFQVIGGSSDNQAPRVTKIDLPNEVVLGQSFKIRVSAEDESGVAGTYAWLALEGGWISNGGSLYASASEPRFITETQTEAIVDQDLVFEEKAPPGKYRVWLSIRDGVGNREFAATDATVTLIK